MTNAQVVKKTAEFVRRRMEGEGTGHDWWHVQRVWQNAKIIGKKEGADLFVVQLAALLHDIADWKFYNEELGPKIVRVLLKKLQVENSVIEKVVYIVQNVSFKGAGVKHKMKTLDGKVVQDADRLDALGAIGIARCFAYGGFKQRPIYDPSIPPVMHKTFKMYKKGKSHSISHFYEKLLLLKDKMNTRTGRSMAIKLHKFMEKYLEQFYKEWNSEL